VVRQRLADAQNPWLQETAQLDISDPKLRITAQKLTQSLQSHAARAAAIHHFVRRMPFIASPDARTHRASVVLREGGGDCHSKGVLFTALCRAAGLPARLLFVSVRPRYLVGLLADAPPSLTHAVGQVLVENEWRTTDGYVLDPIPFARAKQMLRATGQACGWGIVAGADGFWDGRSECLQQFQASDVLQTYGVFHDPAHFYATARKEREHRGPEWLEWLSYGVGAWLVNRRVAQLRHT
jgi:hypothetical protein